MNPVSGGTFVPENETVALLKSCATTLESSNYAESEVERISKVANNYIKQNESRISDGDLNMAMCFREVLNAYKNN